MTETIRKVTGPEAVQRLDAVARRMEPRLRRAFLDAIENVRDRLNAREVARALDNGDVEAVMRLVSPGLLEEDMRQLRAAISDAVLAGGAEAAATQPDVFGPGLQQVRFVFDATNPRLANYAQQISSTRVREISNDIRETVRTTISAGTVAGDNPITTARDVREFVGLTDRQRRAVANYRRMLEGLDAEAMARELRDRRFDPTIARAIRDDKPLRRAQIDKMVERYRQRYVKYRSETIARTESIRSVQGAQHELFQSYVDEGKIEERQVRRFWHYTRDDRTRNWHRNIPSMNPAGVGQNEPFETTLGPLMFPGDPNASGANTINCRCAVFSRIVSMELLEDPDFNVAERFAQEFAREQAGMFG